MALVIQVLCYFPALDVLNPVSNRLEMTHLYEGNKHF